MLVHAQLDNYYFYLELDYAAIHSTDFSHDINYFFIFKIKMDDLNHLK
jgi:hypothetical protein